MIIVYKWNNLTDTYAKIIKSDSNLIETQPNRISHIPSIILKKEDEYTINKEFCLENSLTVAMADKILVL